MEGFVNAFRVAGPDCVGVQLCHGQNLVEVGGAGGLDILGTGGIPHGLLLD